VINIEAAIAEAPMKAQCRLNLDFSWPRITSTFLIDVAVLVLASHLPGGRHTVAWGYGVAIAAVVTGFRALRPMPPNHAGISWLRSMTHSL
jgi:hypothetical protein